MVRCRRCRKEIYDSTYTCPHCGARHATSQDFVDPRDNMQMKKNVAPSERVYANEPPKKPRQKKDSPFSVKLNRDADSLPFIYFWANGLDFKGRTDRKTFNINFLAYVVVLFFICLTLDATIVVLYYLISRIPYLSMLVRRIRDAGKSLAWLIPFFIPPVGIIFLILLMVLPSANTETTTL